MNSDLDELIADLECGDEEICWDAASEIIPLGPSAAAAIQSLTWVLKGPNFSSISPYVAGMAADALGAIGPAAIESVESLEHLAASVENSAEEYRWLRLRAATALWKITGDGLIAMQVASGLMNDPEEWLRGHANVVLASLRVQQLERDV